MYKKYYKMTGEWIKVDPYIGLWKSGIETAECLYEDHMHIQTIVKTIELWSNCQALMLDQGWIGTKKMYGFIVQWLQTVDLVWSYAQEVDFWMTGTRGEREGFRMLSLVNMKPNNQKY